LITLGVYYFVWWYKINREARDFGENNRCDDRAHDDACHASNREDASV
jgi:hypothetical protein